MSEHLSNADFLAVMSEMFDRDQQIRFTPTGRSMLPMLDGKHDTVTLARPSERLAKYDVAFYQRANGQLVLHRVVGLEGENGYIFSGDGQYTYEHGITDDNILALMVRFTHGGKEHTVRDFSYRLYIRRMMIKKRLRIFALRVYHKFFKRKK